MIFFAPWLKVSKDIALQSHEILQMDFLLIGASQKLKILWKGVLKRDTNTGEPVENTSVHMGSCAELWSTFLTV